MANFTHKVLDQKSKESKGLMEAGSENEVRSMLRTQSLYALSIKPENHGFSLLKTLNTTAELATVSRYKKPNTVDKVMFFRQVALMLRSGSTLMQAIEAISQMTPKIRFKNSLVRMLVSIQGGSSFAQSIEKEKHIFPPLVSRLIASGEASGELQVILERLAVNLTRSADLKRQFVTSMFYPTFVAIAAVGVTLFLALSVVPKFATMLEGKSSQLPAATQAMMDGSKYMIDNGAMLGAIFGGGLFLILASYTTAKGKDIIDKILVRLPIIGSSIRSSAMAQMGMTTALLLRSGLTVVDTLAVLEQIMPNNSMSRCFSRAGLQVLSGQNLATGLTQPLIPDMVKHMAGIGEKSGELDQVMDEIGDYFQQQTETKLKSMIAMIEPAMTVLIGGLVGFVYYAFFKAMMQVSAGG